MLSVTLDAYNLFLSSALEKLKFIELMCMCVPATVATAAHE